MYVMRVLAVIWFLSIAVCVGAFFLTGEKRYIGWAWRVATYGVWVGLGFFLLLILERVLAMV